jgi:hypothetical protein
LRSTRSRSRWREIRLLLAEALAKNGQLDAAIGAIEEALAATQDTGELYSRPELHRIKGELIAAKAGS